jgi:hypothetical protein
MAWDSIKIADKFLRQANALHPEEVRGHDSYEEKLARQDVMYECYMNAFSKDMLLTFLNKSVNGTVTIPENVDRIRYEKAYMNEARKVLEDQVLMD